MRNLEIFHNFVFFPIISFMEYSFISLITSNNNPRRAKILQIAISCYSDGKLEAQFKTFVQAVPALTKTEREFLPLLY